MQEEGAVLIQTDISGAKITKGVIKVFQLKCFPKMQKDNYFLYFSRNIHFFLENRNVIFII